MTTRRSARGGGRPTHPCLLAFGSFMPRILIAMTAAALAACSSGLEPLTNDSFAPELGIDLSQMTQTASGLYYQDLTAGTGTLVTAGMTATVHYEGWLVDGTKFDSSRDRGQPFEFPVGAGQVIAGWDEGVLGMRQGGLRRLVIPPDLGYGERAIGPIPANSTLVFEIEVLGVQ